MYVYTIGYIRKSASICGVCVRMCVCVCATECVPEWPACPAYFVSWQHKRVAARCSVVFLSSNLRYCYNSAALRSFVRSFACFLFDFVFVLLTICCGVCVCTCSFWNNSNENAQRQKVLQIKKEGTLLQRLQQQQQHQLYNLKKRLQTSFVCACKARA